MNGRRREKAVVGKVNGLDLEERWYGSFIYWKRGTKDRLLAYDGMVWQVSY